MWIIKCAEHHSKYEFIVGPFGSDDQALAAARELEAAGYVDADVQTLVEPDRAMSGARF